MQARYDLAHLAVQFLDSSLGVFSGTPVKMSDNGRAPLRTEPDELLAGETDPLACLLQRYGRNFQADLVKLLL